LEAILTLHKPSQKGSSRPDGHEEALWLALVRRQIERLTPLAAQERQEDVARVQATLVEAATLATQARASAPSDRAGFLARRRELLSGLVEMYAGRPHVASAVAEARRLLAAP
jgi:hypothetical protein